VGAGFPDRRAQWFAASCCCKRGYFRPFAMADSPGCSHTKSCPIRAAEGQYDSFCDGSQDVLVRIVAPCFIDMPTSAAFWQSWACFNLVAYPQAIPVP
jgi:hypothetical protein